MIANVVLNIILIRRVGLIGAAISTLIAYSVAPLVMLFLPSKPKGDNQEVGLVSNLPNV